MSGLQKLGVKAGETDIVLLRERYDADQDGRIGFWEFANIFLPIDPTVRDDLERRQPQSMSHETLELVNKLLLLAVEIEVRMETIRMNV